MDISSVYDTYLSTAQTASNAKTSNIDKTLNTDLENATDDELMSVCKDFEAYFIEQVFKNMKDTIVEADEDESSSSMLDYFEDTLNQEYAKNASEQGDYGIAQMLYEQMKRNYEL
jgi:peptidoglycan hydrolase FlgJ